ncbi:hypothetical protein Hanom_Chr04g00363721 [Helianthus anomalus]
MRRPRVCIKSVKVRPSTASFSVALASSWDSAKSNTEFSTSPFTSATFDSILLPSESFFLFLRDLRGVPSPSTFISFFPFLVETFLSFSVFFWSCKCCIQQAPSSHLVKLSVPTHSSWSLCRLSFISLWTRPREALSSSLPDLFKLGRTLLCCEVFLCSSNLKLQKK